MKFKLTTTLALLAGLLASGQAVAETTIESIQRDKVLKVCEAQDAPWSSINPISGEWEGLTVDLVKSLATELEAEIEIIDSGWSALVQNLSTGKCHIAAAPMIATVARSKVVLFTQPFAHEGQAAIVKSDSGIKTFADLDKEGNVIAVEAGGAPAVFAQAFFKNATVKVMTPTDKMQMFGDVAASRVQATWTSYISNQLYIAANPGLGLQFLDEKPVGFNAIRWAVPAGEYHFQQLVDKWLEQKVNSGDIQVLWEKWFPGVPYTTTAK